MRPPLVSRVKSHAFRGSVIVRCGRVLAAIASAVAFFGGLDAGRVRAQSQALIFDGFTEAADDVMVSGSDLGRIQSITVKMGDYVQAGDVLAELDDSLQRASLAISRAQADAEGEIQLALADESLQRLRTEKLRQLARDSMARPDELRRAEAELQSATARVRIAKEQQHLRRLQVQRDELQLESRKVIAPTSGVIARVLRAAGEYITPADAAIFQLLTVDRLEAVFNIPVEHINLVGKGDRVRVFLRSQSKTVDAVVDRMSPSIDGQSGTIQIRIIIDNADRSFRSGDRCTLQLTDRDRVHRRTSSVGINHAMPETDSPPADASGRGASQRLAVKTVELPPPPADPTVLTPTSRKDSVTKRGAINRSWFSEEPPGKIRR